MGLLGTLRSWLGSPRPNVDESSTFSPRPAAPPRVAARYDAAQPGSRNAAYWANADGLGPVAAHSPFVRHQLRIRARYEKQNSGYVAGLVKTLAHDLVGSGPRLQLTADGADREAVRRVERAFAGWARAVGLADKLRLMAEATPVDGESFGVLAINDKVRHPVKLDLRVIEADRVAPPGIGPAMFDLAGDGIEYDEAGNPTRYSILRQHPGDYYGTGLMNLVEVGEADWYPADHMVHWFRRDRPGQLRGVCQLAALMTVSPQLRRLTLACLAAAETAAGHAAVLETDLPPDFGGDSTGGPAGPVGHGTPDPSGCLTGGPLPPGETMPVEVGMMVALPAGQKLSQMKAEHPNDRYKEFKHELLNEMGRGVNAPLNVVLGNSSGYNYSSSRLDHRLYYTTVWADRERFGQTVLDPLFFTWAEFAARTPGLDGLFDGLPPAHEWRVDWFFDGFGSIDPVKDAAATEKRLAVGVTTLMEECAAEGKDWAEVMDQRAKELELAKSLGLAPPPASAPPVPADDPADRTTPEAADAP